MGFFSETHMVSYMYQASINHLFWWTAVSFLICEFVIKREKVKDPTEYTLEYILVLFLQTLLHSSPFSCQDTGIQHTFSVQQKKTSLKKKNCLTERKRLSYSLFLADLSTGSDRELSCGPLSPEQFMSSDDRTISVAVCRM